MSEPSPEAWRNAGRLIAHSLIALAERDALEAAERAA